MAIDPSITCYFRGQFMPLGEAKVGILTHALSYGTGCFEGIRGYYNQEEQEVFLFRLGEHYERLHQSARILLMKLEHSVEELSEITRECIRRSNLRGDVYVRPSVFKSSEVIGVRLDNLEEELYVTVQPFGNYIDIDRALNVIVSSWRRLDDNMVPARAKITGSYINSAFAKSEALLSGFDEAIMLTHEGYVSEGSASNLFILRKGVLATPPVSENILEGVTRDTIITLVRDELGIAVEERTIDRTELYVADEIFLCGTGVQIAPVGSVDHRLVGDGKCGSLTTSLQQLYFDVVRGKVAKYRHWCTPAYEAAKPAQEMPALVGTYANGSSGANGHAGAGAAAESTQQRVAS